MYLDLKYLFVFIYQIKYFIIVLYIYFYKQEYYLYEKISLVNMLN
jgi:hypothetical protein